MVIHLAAQPPIEVRTLYGHAIAQEAQDGL